MYWLTVATFNLWGLAEWKGDYVEPSIGFVQEMCWSKNQHTRIDPSSLAEVWAYVPYFVFKNAGWLGSTGKLLLLPCIPL